MSVRPAPTRRRRLAWLAAILALLVAATPPVLGMRIIAPTVDGPLARSAQELEDQRDAILDGAVREDEVDYRLIASRQEALERLAVGLASVGPRSTPAAFADRDSRLAYYINAYNTLVVLAIVQLHVRGGVHDVHGLIEPAAGMGFFWALRFRLDGELVSLHSLETGVIRARFDDARVHAALNCASRSCPALSSRAYRGATLDAQLEEATGRFVSSPFHVHVDDASRTLELSSIFQWYESDFVEDARRLGEPAHVLSWAAAHAPADRRAAIERARAEDYDVRYTDYDWRLNGHW